MRLYLCEKPSQGKDIARVLGANQRGEGCLTGPNVTVSWCIGHLVEAAAPDRYGAQYRSWSLEHLPIIPSRWQVEIKPSAAAQFKVVQRLLAQADELVIATDADREGEMIARELLELCDYRKPVQRLWLAALNDASIRKALATLRPGSETLPLYHAALARSRADWLIGMNLSRLFTLLGRKAGYNGVLSVGRVQTPTLQLVVRRDREIAQFVSKPYWVIDVRLTGSARTFMAQWVAPPDVVNDSGQCVREAVAHSALDIIRRASQAHVTSIETERVREPAPLLFDLGTLQEVCSKRLGLDVQETLDIAQALYERHKATTYPRSDCGYLPESMLAEVPHVLDAVVAADPSVKPLVETLDTSIRSRVWNDAKITAHHGIIPTLEPPTLSSMSDKELQVYRLIRSHYLAQFLPPHEFDRTLARLSCSNLVLLARGKRIAVRGWRSVVDSVHLSAEADDDTAQDQELPPLTQSAACEVTNSKLRALKTLPPKPYTQGDLIKAMKSVARWVTDPRLKQKLKDTTGIGTEATRAGIIQGLLTRGYLIKQGRSIRASQPAYTLIDAVPSAIADPGTTAVWEQALDLVAARQMTLDEFVAKQSSWVAQLVRDHAHSTLSLPLPDVPACPTCGARTRQRKGAHGSFWSCTSYPDCRGTLPVVNAAGRTSKHPASRRSKRR